jgi:phage-related protein
MANETLGASFSIDVTNLKAGISQANRLIRESQSEFQAAAAGMDDWTKSEEGLTKKIKSLNDISDIQRKKVSALQSEYDRLIAGGLDPVSKEAVELRTKINNETAAMEKNEKEALELKKALDELRDGADGAGDSAEKSALKMGGFGTLAKAAVGAIAGLGAAVGGAVAGFLSLAESTREARNNMAKLETSFQSAGHSAETAENTFTELYGILGDDGAATEAAQQLAKISKDEADLAANTRILTGVMAEYGNSIPTEGLAEGMAATAAMGSVQGVLADALEWQGVNLDDYNAKLETLATEEERAAYIQETLTDLYGESADAYRENNAEVIAAQEAQAELNNTLNELGAIAEPIMTSLKTLAAELLTSIMPFVQLIGEGLTGALNGSGDAAALFSEGITGIVATLLEKVTGVLPTVIDLITTLIPQILTALLEQLPTILETLVEMVTQIITALSEMLPTIVTAIMEVLPQLINSLIASIPQLLEAATTLLMSIVNCLPTIITALINALPAVIQTIITALINSIPILLNAAIQLLTAIVQAIPTIIDALITNLPSIIDTIINGVLDALPLLLDAAIKLFFAIIDATPTIIAELTKAMPKIIETILRSVANAIPKLFSTAKTLLGKIIEAIGDLIKKLPSHMGSIITSIVKGLKDGISKVKTIGSDIVKGLWNGIKDMGSWIAKKIKGFGNDVLGGIKSFFGIKSPSRVMADEVGKNLALGIGVGFEKNIGAVNKEITDAMNFDDGISGGGGVKRGGGGLTVYQTNNYKQAYTSRYEKYKSNKELQATARLIKAGAIT